MSVRAPQKRGDRRVENEPAAARPAFELIESKLAVPFERPGDLERRALVERLLAAREHVVVLAAPAGYGKTTLLRQWAAGDPRRFAWLTLDSSDEDPIALLTYVAAALDRIEPVGPEVFEALASPGRSIRSAALPRLGAALATRSEPVVIVLDDLHRIEGRESLEAIATLVEHLPPGSALAVSSRADPALGLARLRAEGRLLELGLEDLRLDADAAGALLAGAGLELREEEVDELVRVTEGWPAGLYLAALSLRSGSSLADVVGLGGADRHIADYFREELLANLSPDETEFLVGTSVLGRMSGPLCDAVLDRKGSAALLEALERSNLFLVPLDHGRAWYRYHHLFRDLLRAELTARGRVRVQALNRRAAAWAADNGDVESAIRYARKAEDVDRLAELVARQAMPTYYSGRIATLEGWLEWFDDGALARHTPIAVFGAWVRLLTGRPEEAELWAQAAELGAPRYERPLPDGSASVTSWTALVRAVMCADGVERMQADARVGIETLAPHSIWRPTAHVLLGVAHQLAGDDESADLAWGETVELAIATGATDTAVHGLSHQALLALRREELGRARELLERAILANGGHEPGSYLTHVIWVAVGARIAQQAGDRARAEELLARAEELRPLLSWGIPWLAVETQLELARVRLALGDISAARPLLRETVEILRRRPLLGVLGDRAAEARGRLDELNGARGNWAASLTAAELRLLPLLTSHLSFAQIGERLSISRNTVKTEAISIYRKLGASSRNEAVVRATELGLLDEAFLPSAREPAAEE